MKKGLFILLIFCFSLTIISCSDDKEESTTDTTAPVIEEVTAVTTPTKTPHQITLFHSKFQKTIFSYYCTVKLHVSDSALPPLVSEATTFQ